MPKNHPLDAFFYPKNVAVIGAKDTPGSVGRTLMLNLTQPSFQGKVFPVNPKHEEVMGLRCYPTVSAIGEPIDLAVIAVPSAFIPDIMCEFNGVSAVIVISAGFKEAGPEGEKLEREVTAVAREKGIRMIGPNCLGLMNPHHGLNASFAGSSPRKGSLAFISQSGALCTAVLDWSLSEEIGFSSFVSIGSMADVGWADLIEYFGTEEHTKAILIYLETVGDPKGFFAAAREVAFDKPIIVIKPGRSAEAARAAASHTGALTGSDAVFDALCERACVLRVQSIGELFDMAEVVDRQPLPKGPRMGIVTNAGGPGVLATDAVIEFGAKMAELSTETIGKLNVFLPKAWSHSNPVDILGDADPHRYDQAVQTVLGDGAVDGLLVILTPQEMSDPTGTADLLQKFSHISSKPLMVSWMGGNSVHEGRQRLAHAGIPSFEYPDEAVWAFSTLWRHSQILHEFADPPHWRPFPDIHTVIERREKANAYFSAALQKGRTLLSEHESKELLQLYGFPVVQTLLATSCEEAVEAAKETGFPVVLKVHSHTVTHKAKYGGVVLHVKDVEGVRDAYKNIEKNITSAFGQETFLGVTLQRMVERGGVELIVGSSVDPQFGPVLLFGTGGSFVEGLADRALAIPPLSGRRARLLMEKTKGWKMVTMRCEPQVQNQLEEFLYVFSHMIIENPSIVECDINPVLAMESELMSLDARFVICEREKQIASVCRTYPWEYVKKINGLLIRPVRPEDGILLVPYQKKYGIQDKRLFRSLFGYKIVLVAQSSDQTLDGLAILKQKSGEKAWELFVHSIDDQICQELLDSMYDIARHEHITEIALPLFEPSEWAERNA